MIIFQTRWSFDFHLNFLVITTKDSLLKGGISNDMISGALSQEDIVKIFHLSSAENLKLLLSMVVFKTHSLMLSM